jgi:hypothetical protein
MRNPTRDAQRECAKWLALQEPQSIARFASGLQLDDED